MSFYLLMTAEFQFFPFEGLGKKSLPILNKVIFIKNSQNPSNIHCPLDVNNK